MRAGLATLLLAPLFADVVGVDADSDMLVEAARQATRAGIEHVTWRRLSAEELPADLPTPTLVTFAQSFHWLDRDTVARAVHRMLAGNGALVHIGATTHEGTGSDDTDQPLEHPRPPRDAIGALIRRYLGDARRAGRTTLPDAVIQDDREEDVFRAAGFVGPERIELPDRAVTRTAEEIRASVYSLSIAAPNLFGARFDDFDGELRALIAAASPAGVFGEHLRGITVDVWRPARIPT